MQKFDVQIAPVAIEELDEITLYIARDSVSEALKWASQMEDKIQSLESAPERCPVADESQHLNFEVHHLIVGNYRVLFHIEPAIVQVLHIKSRWQARKL